MLSSYKVEFKSIWKSICIVCRRCRKWRSKHNFLELCMNGLRMKFIYIKSIISFNLIKESWWRFWKIEN